MTEAEIALAREAVACKHWEWMPGMLDINGRRIIRVDGDKLTVAWYGNPHHWLAPDITVVSATDFPPDLSDPATVGCLEALVRKAWRDPSIYVAPCTELHADGTSPVWFVYTGRGRGPIGTGPTRAAALVAALEAAP